MPTGSGSEGAAVTATTKGGGGGGAAGLKKGPWTAAEDGILLDYVKKHGEGNWNAVQRNSGLSRCGKSCRLRWANHLRPNLKKGSFSPEEERLILELHSKLGNKWARMAAQMPGRTDNEIKNYWNTRIKRRQRAGLPLYPPDIQRQAAAARQAASPLQQDHKALYGGIPAPLSLFDPPPINFSLMPPAMPMMRAGSSSFYSSGGIVGGHRPELPSLVDQQHHLKRRREENLGFSVPFFGNPVSPPMIPYNSGGNHEQGQSPLPMLQQSQQQQQQFSIKMELPSNQYYLELPPADVGSGQLARNNSGLLDAMLEDARGVSGGSGWNGEHGVGEDSQRTQLMESMKTWDDVLSQHSKVTKLKNEPVEGIESDSGDLSAMFDMMPPQLPAGSANMAGGEWYGNGNGNGNGNNDSGEVSNGQSSAVTDDGIGLEMQQFASTISMAAEDNAWNIGSSNWDDGMTGIC